MVAFGGGVSGGGGVMGGLGVFGGSGGRNVCSDVIGYASIFMC